MFITEDFYELISVQTNLYADQYIEANPDNATSRQWKATTAKEIRHFLALYLLTGFIQKPQVRQYWSTDPLLLTSIFNQVMSRNRFQKILEFLHIADNSNYDANDPNRNKPYKVRYVVEFLIDRFKTSYLPAESISVDEELLLWKGRLSLDYQVREPGLELSCLVFAKILAISGNHLCILVKLLLVMTNNKP